VSRKVHGWLLAASCASGAILLYSSPILPPLSFFAAFLAAFCLLWFATCRFIPAGAKPCLTVLVGLLLGGGWTAWHAGDQHNSDLPAELEGRPLQVQGYLCDRPTPGNFGSQRFSLCVTGWGQVPDLRLPDKLRLSIYGDKARQVIPHTLQATVVLKRPHGSVNPTGFRYESWLFRHGYGATGSVRELEALPSTGCSLVCAYHQWRSGVIDGLEDQLGHAVHYPLAVALLSGYRGKLTGDHWDTLKATGTIHLVAISGLHLGLVAVAAAWLSRVFLVSLFAHRLSAQTLRTTVFWSVVLVSTGYALLAGFTVPTRRALLMVVVGSWFLTRAARPPLWQAWLVSLSGVLLLDPAAPLDRGFWLSFLAVAVLLLLFGGRVGRPGAIRGLVMAQAGIFAGLLPALVWAGEGSPLAGLLANLLAIPLISLVVMPVLMVAGLLLSVLPGNTSWIGWLVDVVLGALWAPLEALAGQAVPTLYPDPGVALLVSVLFLALAMIPGSRASMAAFLLVSVWAWQESGALNDERDMPPDHFRVHIWDVGQGLSVLLEYGDRTLLYDTGPAIPGSYSAVENVLLPNFRTLDIHRIDTLLVSHADSDHSGGLRPLLESLPVGRIISGEPAALRERLPGKTVEACPKAFASESDLVNIRLWRSDDPREGNDSSCVLLVEAPGMILLLPGDITRGTEAELVGGDWLPDRAEPGRQPNYRLMLAPHHGSNTSSGDTLLDAFRPDLTLFSAGYRHRYGHPHPDVLERYRKHRLATENIACSGAITFAMEEGRMRVTRSRDSAGFWIDPPGPPCEQM
jgi:competence protein ComEC